LEINIELFKILGALLLISLFVLSISNIRKKNEIEAEKRWIEFVNSSGGNLYKRSWMAMNKKTGFLEGGTSPIPYKEAKEKNLIPRRILSNNDNIFFTNITIFGDGGSCGGGDVGGGDC
jgi:hypothetical protein